MCDYSWNFKATFVLCRTDRLAIFFLKGRKCLHQHRDLTEALCCLCIVVLSKTHLFKIYREEIVLFDNEQFAIIIKNEVFLLCKISTHTNKSQIGISANRPKFTDFWPNFCVHTLKRERLGINLWHRAFGGVSVVVKLGVRFSQYTTAARMYAHYQRDILYYLIVVWGINATSNQILLNHVCSDGEQLWPINNVC